MLGLVERSPRRMSRVVVDGEEGCFMMAILDMDGRILMMSGRLIDG